MQSNIKIIYQRASEKNNISPDKVKFIGDVIFKELDEKIKNPPSLILYIKHLGRWFLRKKKMERYVNKLESYKYEVSGKNDVLLPILKERLLDYNVFLETKRKFKEIRHANQKLIQPLIKEEDV